MDSKSWKIRKRDRLATIIKISTQVGNVPVITRKQDQTILINSNIEIFISAINENEVKVGVNTTEDVEDVRGELVDEN